MKRNKVYVVILTIINIILSFLMILEVFFFRSLIDHALLKVSIKKDIIIIISTIVGMVVLRFFFLFLRNKYNLSLEMELKKKLFSSLYKAQYQSLMRLHSSKVLSLYLDDIKNISETKSYVIPQLVSQISRIVFAFLALIKLNYFVVLGLSVVGALMFIFSATYGKYVKGLNKKVLSSNDRLNCYLDESYQNLRFLHVMAEEQTIINKTDFEFEKNYKIKNRRNNLQVITNTFVTSAMLVLYGAVMCYSAYLITKDRITYGTLTALVSLVSYFEAPFSQLGTLISRFALFGASKLRINEILSLKCEINDNSIVDFDKISLEDISFSYGDRKIFNHFNLEINKNDIISIKGPSGVGKTTLLNILLGFYNVKGNAYVSLEDKKYRISGSTRSLFSYVPQENILFSGSIRDNFRMLDENIKDDEIKEALIRAGIYNEIEDKGGISYQLFEGGKGLSVGQIQRILIAIALVKKRPILIMDEFSSALDKKNENEIVKMLKDLNQTIIFVSHRDLDINARVIDLEELNENN